ncbi:DMT family transporter [Synechococcus sp. RSCCF101]|uniref:DMT family transporter n=1 Tax=Synechococcus sp. RSCCF101 TaxID=2511069 RepID=UPI001CD9387F|nr:DMT family transporter [Synechococcus sp. RSCCF101]
MKGILGPAALAGGSKRFVVASALSFSLMTVCVKQLAGRIPVAEVLLARSLITLAITAVLLRREGVWPWGHRRGWLVLRGLVGTGALLCVFAAITRLPLATATVLQYTYPTFTAVMGWLLLKEQVARRLAVAVLLGWTGVLLVVEPSWLSGAAARGLDPLSVAIALGGALMTSLAYVCVRHLGRSEHPLVIVFYFPLVSVPIVLPAVLGNFVMPIGSDWLWLLGVGVFTQLGQVWITRGLTLLPAARATAISYVQVVFASLWGVWLFAEPIDGWMVSGAAVVLLATVLSASARSRNI